jgi:hypothetical protein
MGRGKGVFFLSLIALLALAICAPVSLALASDPGNIAAIEVNPQVPSTVYVATAQAGVLKTTDNGATWTAKNAGLPTRTINGLAVDPFVPHNIYIATDSGAYRSENHGDTWGAVLPGIACTAVTVDTDTPGVLYLGTASKGVYASSDYGQTWQNLQNSGQMKGINGLAVITTVDNPQTQGMGFNKSADNTLFKTIYAIDQSGIYWASVALTPGGHGGLADVALACGEDGQQEPYIHYTCSRQSEVRWERENLHRSPRGKHLLDRNGSLRRMAQS